MVRSDFFFLCYVGFSTITAQFVLAFSFYLFRFLLAAFIVVCTLLFFFSVIAATNACSSIFLAYNNNKARVLPFQSGYRNRKTRCSGAKINRKWCKSTNAFNKWQMAYKVVFIMI